MLSSHSVRPARLSDCGELESIQVRTSLMWPDYRRRFFEDPAWIGAPVEAIRTGRVLVVESGGEAAGFAVVARRSDGDAEIEQLFLCPGHWGSEALGILLSAIADRALSEGAWSVWIATSRAGAPFYETHGFAELETGLTDNDVRLQRPLHRIVGAA